MLAATLIQWVLSYLKERAFVANLFIMGTRLYQIQSQAKRTGIEKRTHEGFTRVKIKIHIVVYNQIY